MHSHGTFRRRLSSQLVWLLLVILMLTPIILPRMLVFSPWSGYFHGFSMMFISILLEALPFVLLGTLVSSFIHFYLSEGALARLLPRNRFLGLLAASTLGFIFPVCECAIVPIVRGLVRKGVPMGIAVTFLLAVPIVNPVVLTSTYFAFGGSWGVVLLRGLCGMMVAIFAGDLLGRVYEKRNPLRAVQHKEHEAG